jgi:hypothetical protein
MARINWQGTEIEAGLLDMLENGNYRMVSQGSAARIEPGTIIEVRPDQIIGLSHGASQAPVAAAANPMPSQGPAAQGTMPQTITAADVGQMPMSIFPPSDVAAKTDTPPAAPVVIAREQPLTDVAKALDAGAAVSVLPRPTPSRTTMATTITTTTATAPAGDHFKTLVSTLRVDVRNAVAKAQAALKTRGPASLAAFGVAHKALSDVYDEVDAATAEINGALQEPTGNGAPAGTEVKN